MKKLFENFRKYTNEVDTDDDGIPDEKELAIIDKGELPAETERPDFEELKTVIREEIQVELLRNSKYGFKAPYGDEQTTLWRVAQAVMRTASGASMILGSKIEKRFREEFPDQIIDKGYTLELKGGSVGGYFVLIRRVAEEVFELYDLIKTLDAGTKTKIYNMVYAADGVGWVQALEILRTLQ